MLNYFLIDWDGCLFSSISLWVKAYKNIFKEYGIAVTTKNIPKKVMGDKKAPLNLGIPLKEEEEFYKKLFVEYKRLLKEVPYSDIFAPYSYEVIKKLKEQGKGVCIVTSSWRSAVEPILNKHPLKEYIDFIIGWEDVTNLKPHSEPVLKALKKYKATPKESIIVGDSSKDIIAGKKAGIKTALYFPKEHKEYYSLEDLKSLEPDYVIDSFKDLLKFL